jgi:hypothetical protein
LHLGRFHTVIAHLARHLERAALPEKLRQCTKHLDQYASGQAAQLDSFRKSVSTLFDAARIDDAELRQPFAQQVLMELKIEELLPDNFIASVNAMIAERSFDPTGLSTRLKEYTAKLTETITKVMQISGAFAHLDVEYEKVASGAAEIGFLLPRAVVGDSLKELTNEFHDLRKLFRAVNELLGANDYDPKVVTIASSWWQVFLELDPAQLLVWVVAIERIVSLFKSNLEIKNIQRQLKDRNVSQEIVDLLEKEVDRRVSDALQELASDLRHEHSKIDDQARANEIETQLRHGLYYLAKRINQGAQIEMNVGVPAEADPTTTAPAEDMAPDVAARVQAAKQNIAALRDLRTRAQSASAQTLTIDTTAPLLLTSEPQHEDASGRREPPSGA